MASIARSNMTALLRSSGSTSAIRCCCSKPASMSGSSTRRFLATVVDAHQQQQQQSTDSSTTSSVAQAVASTVNKVLPKSLKIDATPAAAASAPTTRLQPPSGSEARRAPQPVPAEQAEQAQQIYLPNLSIYLIRNSPKEAKNPFIATFRVPVQLTKPDIVSYLYQIYGLKVTSISTITEMGEMIRGMPGRYKGKRRLKNTKKAIVGMEQPFWFPDVRPRTWLKDNFEKDSRDDYTKRRLMPIGDGGPGRGRRSFRWRGANASKQGIGARYSQIVKRLQERRDLQEEQVGRLIEQEKIDMVERLKSLQV